MALTGLFVSSLVLAFPSFLMVQAVSLPLLNDVTTDSADPPNFSRSAKALAARGGRTPAEPPQAVRDAQRQAYPNIQPIVLDLEADEAYALILKAIAARHWQIIEQQPPGGRSGLGHIDAVDHTLVMGLPQDVTVRVRPLAGQTRIDLRSASRFGRHDFGDNASRIQAFGEELQAEIESK